MNPDEFSADSPGELVKIDGGEVAFVPEPLPPKWTFPSRLWPLLGEAKQQVGILEGLGRNLPEPAILLRPLEDREALRSSRMEGTYATPEQLLLFEIQPRKPKSEEDPVNAWLEVFNYRRALDEGHRSELPLCWRLIRRLHEVLLSGVRGADRRPGEFRQVQVYLGSTKRFIPPPPLHLQESLNRFEKYLHNNDTRYDPLVDSFLVHYQFETIHPFIDGNGRIGRVLLAMMLQKQCSLSKPWLYMSAFFEKYRKDYTDKLFNVSARSDWSEWIEFCLEGTVFQAKDAIRRCEKLLSLKSEFDKRAVRAGGSIRLNEIIELVFCKPYFRVADLARRLGVSYPTARSDVDRLVEADILSELPDITPITFHAPEVFRVAYEDFEG